MAFQGALDRCDALLAYIDALPVIGEEAVAKKGAKKVQVKTAAKVVEQPKPSSVAEHAAKVRALKLAKAPKEEIKAAVVLLLAAKKEAGVDPKAGKKQQQQPKKQKQQKQKKEAVEQSKPSSVAEHAAKVRALKLAKAPKEEIKAAVVLLLAAKKEAGIDPKAGKKQQQQPKKQQQQNQKKPSVAELADKVRALKLAKAPKEEIKAAVVLLLAAKKEAGIEGAVPKAGAKKPKAVEQPKPSSVAELADKVRALKLAKAPKEEIKAAVVLLLAAKKEAGIEGAVPKAGKKQQQQKPKAVAAEQPAGDLVDMAKKFDFRVGKVVKVGDHPNADSIYLEEIDVGEEKPRQVLSGLKKHITPENFLNSYVIVFANLKPSKIRGVASHAMVLCAKSADGSKVELMRPPAGSKPGERVFLEGHDFTDAQYKPDERINARKKNSPWVKFAPHLKTNDNNEMSYCGARLMLSKGPIVSQTLPNSLIA